MRNRPTLLLLLWLVLLLWLGAGLGAGAAATAARLTVGSAFPETRLRNQHDEWVKVSREARVILFAVEKPASDLVNGYLEKQPSDHLEKNQACFIVDISAMPGMITRMFALPKMRKRPYPILIAKDAGDVAFIPRQADRVTVIRLSEGLIRDIRYAATEGDLERML